LRQRLAKAAHHSLGEGGLLAFCLDGYGWQASLMVIMM